MLSEDRVKGSFGIGIGILMAVVLVNFVYPQVPPAIRWICMLPALATFVAGCTFYSKSKGYSPYLGLLGFGWIFGLVPLILLPDRKDNFMKELSDELDRRRTRGQNSEEEEEANVS